MQVLAELIITFGAAILAYFAVAAESRARGWTGALTVGVFLAVFGGIVIAFSQLWSLFQRKLVDDVPSENALLIIGLLSLALVVVLILDLLGRINIMSTVQGAAGPGQQSSGSTSSPQSQHPPQQQQEPQQRE